MHHFVQQYFCVWDADSQKDWHCWLTNLCFIFWCRYTSQYRCTCLVRRCPSLPWGGGYIKYSVLWHYAFRSWLALARYNQSLLSSRQVLLKLHTHVFSLKPTFHSLQKVGIWLIVGTSSDRDQAWIQVYGLPTFVSHDIDHLDINCVT